MSAKTFSHIAISLALAVSSQSFAQSSSSGSMQTMASGATGIATSGKIIAYESPKCTASSGSGAMACLLTAAGILGVVTSAAAMKGSSTTNSDISSSGDGFGTTAGTTAGTTPGAGVTTDPAVAAANQALNGLAPLGYNVNAADGTITTPKGTFPASAFGSGASLAAVGAISPDDVDKMNAEIKALQDRLKVTSMPLASGSGGAAGSGGKTKFEFVDDPANANGRKLGIGATRTAGLTRSLASGESIGAQVDDIFAMIKRAYQKKTDEKTFVGQ